MIQVYISGIKKEALKAPFYILSYRQPFDNTTQDNRVVLFNSRRKKENQLAEIILE